MIVIKNIVDQESEVTFDDVSQLVGTCDTVEECKKMIEDDFDDEDGEYELDWDMFEYDSVQILIVGDDDDNVMFEGGYVIL